MTQNPNLPAHQQNAVPARRPSVPERRAVRQIRRAEREAAVTVQLDMIEAQALIASGRFSTELLLDMAEDFQIRANGNQLLQIVAATELERVQRLNGQRLERRYGR